MQKYLRGQVWWCNSQYNSDLQNCKTEIDRNKLFEHIQNGMRPVLIVSNNAGNKNSEIVQVVPCTTAQKKSLPTHCSFYINRQRNTFLCEQMTTVNKNNLRTYLITLDEYEMGEVEKCLQISLGIARQTKYDKIEIKQNRGDSENERINKDTVVYDRPDREDN